MTSDCDPFTHHPELRDRIIDPLKSDLRDLDLAFLDERMIAAGAPADWRHSDSYREESRRESLRGRQDGDLWVFAYGSLIWDPAFRFSEVRTALLRGYERRFCIKTELGRGTPEKPGLMAGLDIGSACSGIVFRIDRYLIDAETRLIWKREMLLHAYSPVFVRVETQLGEVEALAFVVDPTAECYLPDLGVEETAHYMATGSGVLGSSLAYIESLAEHFETIGIEDRALFQLRDLSRQMAVT